MAHDTRHITHACVYVCTYECIHVRMRVCMYTCTYICTYVWMYVKSADPTGVKRVLPVGPLFVPRMGNMRPPMGGGAEIDVARHWLPASFNHFSPEHSSSNLNRFLMDFGKDVKKIMNFYGFSIPFSNTFWGCFDFWLSMNSVRPIPNMLCLASVRLTVT